MKNGVYTVIWQLSKGGMGAIYLAKQDIAGTSRTVVIKELLDYFDPANLIEAQKANRRFRDEAITLVSINHPGIPQIYDYFSDSGHNYIVMQYIEGQDLSEGLTRQGASGMHISGKPYPLKDMIRWAIQVCQILEYLGKQSPPIIHHDIKPANLIVDHTTGDIRLVDFGTAKARLVAQAGGKVGLQKSSIFGTQGYAPPEQFSGSSEPRSDVYAFGATLYHCLTDDDPSDHPFDFPKLHILPPDLARAIYRAVESDVTKRSTASELRADLEAAEKALASGMGNRAEYVVVLHQVSGPLQSAAEQALCRLGFTPGKAKVLAYQAPVVIYRGPSEAQALQVLSALKTELLKSQLCIPDFSHSAGLDRVSRQELESKGHVNTAMKRLPEDRKCLCIHCRYTWISNKLAGEPPPLRCPGCKRKDWSNIKIVKCRICGHEIAAANFPSVCPACLVPQQQRRAADILISPTSIDLGSVAVGESASARIKVSGAGGGGIRGEAYTNCPWLHLSSTGFEQNADLLVTVNTNLLAPNTTHKAVLQIVSGAGIKSVPVQIQALPPPKLHAQPSSLDFGTLAAGKKGSLQIRISNQGAGLLKGQVATSQAWITCGQSAFTGNTVLDIYVNTAQLSGGQSHAGEIYISSTGGSMKIPVRVNVAPKGKLESFLRNLLQD